MVFRYEFTSPSNPNFSLRQAPILQHLLPFFLQLVAWLMLQSTSSGLRQPCSAFQQLCDLGQVTSPLWASIHTRVERDNIKMPDSLLALGKSYPLWACWCVGCCNDDSQGRLWPAGGSLWAAASASAFWHPCISISVPHWAWGRLFLSDRVSSVCRRDPSHTYPRSFWTAAGI